MELNQREYRAYRECRLCPRLCRVDRLAGERGFCGQGGRPVLALANLHKGEEPAFLGRAGSGTLFFSGCTLRCSYCQNLQISRGGMGREVSLAELADIFLALERAGAANINLVTATPFIPSVTAALREARRRGLSLPLLWNSSGWESPEGVELLKPVVDVWLPDLKTLNRETASRFFQAPGYPEAATRILPEMAAGHSVKIEGELMTRGLVVRHLVLPGLMAESRRVLEWFAANLADRAWLSLMVQYMPPEGASGLAAADYIMSDSDYSLLMGWLEEFGIEEGFVQEPAAADPEWIPDFGRENPFPDGFSQVLWHWKGGFTL